MQVPRIAANLGEEETNYEALVDQLFQDGIQVSDVNLDPQDADYCERRARKYSWWHNMEAAVRQHGPSSPLVDEVLIQDKLDQTAKLARTLSKSVKFGIEIKHFLFAHDSPEILQEKDALAKTLKAKTLRLQKLQEEPGSKRQKTNDGDRIEVAGAGPTTNSGVFIMNSGVQSKRKKATPQSGDDDAETWDELFHGDAAGEEPRWFKIHRTIHRDLGCPGDWSPVADDKPPQQYQGNVFYNSLRWRDRDILAMLDTLTTPESLPKDVAVDLPLRHVIKLCCFIFFCCGWLGVGWCFVCVIGEPSVSLW